MVLAGWVAKPRGNARKPTKFKSKTKALDLIWWRIDENTHQSVIIFASEQDAKDEVALRNENRKKTAEASGHKMVEETMGPIISIMSDL